MQGFVEAGLKQPVVDTSVTISNSNPNDDPRYAALVSRLRSVHGELLKLNLVENPAIIGDKLGELRLGANQLFAYMNVYIDMKVDLEAEYAQKRQRIYEEQLKNKKSDSAAEKHCREVTRIDETNVKIIDSRIQQIKNEYERYNGICMYLQSRMKEFNTERMVG